MNRSSGAPVGTLLDKHGEPHTRPPLGRDTAGGDGKRLLPSPLTSLGGLLATSGRSSFAASWVAKRSWIKQEQGSVIWSPPSAPAWS